MMHRKKQATQKEAFTIIELLIVITIISILAVSTVSGTGRLIRNIRFTSSFDAIVFLVQEARGAAARAEESGLQYDVSLTSGVGGTAASTVSNSEDMELISNYNIELFVFKDARKTASCATATISFSGAAALTLKCDEDFVPFLVIGICERIPPGTPCNMNPTARQKSFVIDGAAGIPQLL